MTLYVKGLLAAMVTRHIVSEHTILTVLGTGLILMAVIIRRHQAPARKDAERVI